MLHLKYNENTIVFKRNFVENLPLIYNEHVSLEYKNGIKSRTAIFLLCLGTMVTGVLSMIGRGSAGTKKQEGIFTPTEK